MLYGAVSSLSLTTTRRLSSLEKQSHKQILSTPDLR